MSNWLLPLIVSICLAFGLASGFYLGGYTWIVEHHVLATSTIGIVIGLPMLLWRTLVANEQLKTSFRIAETANTDRIDSTFVGGVNMIGHDSPATNSAGITVLTDLVKAHPRYTTTVVASFCGFVRAHSDRDRTFNDQNYEIFKAFDQWYKPEHSQHVDKTRMLNLRSINVAGIMIAAKINLSCRSLWRDY